MQISAEALAAFLFAYAESYREAYKLATLPTPNGMGYPSLQCSPFLRPAEFNVYIVPDGVIIDHQGVEPDSQWYLAGGPAIQVDYEPTLVPPQVIATLKSAGIWGKPRGIYRIVAKEPVRDSVWRGRVKKIISQSVFSRPDLGLTLNIREVDAPLSDVVNTLSYGAFGDILDFKLPVPSSPIGRPYVTTNFGIFTADLRNRRFFTHLEIHGHSDTAAWDPRYIPLRTQSDLRRDLAVSLADPLGEYRGRMSFGREPDLSVYVDRLARLDKAIAALRMALQVQGDDVESVFHEVLQNHPLLLDVYGTCESKPQFIYPEGQFSPIGKSFLVPDFLVRYSDRSYKLVEIERPAKGAATTQGQPRAEVGQAVFQCAEWVHFINTHYQTLANRYPDIQARCKTAVIMSRTNQRSFPGIDDVNSYKGLMMAQFRIDEFFTYDDLYDRAKTAYDLLAGLRPNLPAPPAGRVEEVANS